MPSECATIQIGEVVGSVAKNIKNKLTAFAAIYIYPEYRNIPLDVASIEADISIDPEEKGIHAIDVQDITGIALGNSNVNKPGFASATLQGELQAFADRLKLTDKPKWRLGYKTTNRQERKFKLIEEA